MTKTQLRLPAHLVAWRDTSGRLNVRTETTLAGLESMTTAPTPGQLATIEASFQRENPHDVVHQAVWLSAESDLATVIAQDDGGVDEVIITRGRDYPTLLVQAVRSVPSRRKKTNRYGLDRIRIQGRITLENRFVVLGKLEVRTDYSETERNITGYSPDADPWFSEDPLHSTYTGTPVAYLLSSLSEGVSELGEQCDLWPGNIVVLSGRSEDDARRSSHRAESFDTPLGKVNIVHEAGVVAFSFVNFDLGGKQRVSASAWMRRDVIQDETGEGMNPQQAQAFLSLDPVMVLSSTGEVSAADRSRCHGIFVRAAQHVLDTDPAWYGLTLRS